MAAPAELVWPAVADH